MTFTTLFFGNGLGRAIDNNYFSLGSGIANVWNNTSAPFVNVLTQNEKLAILNCLPLINGQTPVMPQNESELLALQLILNSCKRIEAYHRTPNQILSNIGLNLSKTVEFLIRNVAFYFHGYNIQIPGSTNRTFVTFYNCLHQFIVANSTHVATTNYDNILYQNFITNNIFSNLFATTRLVDGFTGQGNLVFDEDNLERKNNNNFGWYLHLHGSPLFYTDMNHKINKLNAGNAQTALRNFNFPGYFEHIVLNHFSLKPNIISSSTLLNTYWEYFVRALIESHRLVVFGYGGADVHINKVIENWISETSKINNVNKKLVVVYRDQMDIAWLQSIISNRFGNNVPNWFDLKHHPNLLTYNWII
jgi:hypothetical protein